MAELLALDDVARSYPMGRGEVHALRGVSLRAERGDYLALMGPSGSGKSTLLHLLGCLDRPSRGHYRIDGTDVGSLDDEALSRLRNRKIGFVFQAFFLIPELDVAENDGSWVRQVIDSTSEVVLSGAEVLEVWYDADGSVQRRGMTWALACMKTDQSVAELAAKLKAASEEALAEEDEPSREAKIAKVRERAAAAFDELEAAEAAKAKAREGRDADQDP